MRKTVLDEILNLIESVSEDFPSYSTKFENHPLETVETLYMYLTMQKLPKMTKFERS